MQPTDNVLNQINEAITKGQSGIIVLPANPTMDAMAAGTALYLGLTKLGKNVTLTCANTPENELIAADKIQNALVTKGDNLVISFPYIDGSIDKVDYNIEGEKFNLIITPRQGQPKLDASKVVYNYVGGKIDFIITVDAPNLNSLGEIYTANQQEFQGKTIINIDRHLINNMYGAVNMVVKTSSSTSELILKVLQNMQVEIDKDMATNLYTGLTTATNYFTSYSVNADTFETAAALLKYGAVKKPPVRQVSQTQPQQAPTNTNSTFVQQQTPKQFVRPQQSQQNQNTYRPQPQEQRPATQVPQKQENNSQEQSVQAGENNQQAAPQDWLKPKIFRGGGLL